MGRGAPSSSLYDDAARASSAIVIDRYSTSFGWAARLLREPVRTHVRCIYALVRVADELVDDDRQPWSRDARARLLDELQADVHRAIEARGSANLVVHAFTLTARECGIRADLIDPFFESMRADLTVAEHSEESLARYVYGSAEVVGLMCLRIFVAGDEGEYARLAPAARRLGSAFQKLNFVRDLANDKTLLGRTYFPLASAEFTDTERDIIMADIDEDLAAAARMIPDLPTSSRAAVSAAHMLFAELSRRLKTTPAHEIVSGRVRVPNPVKARIIASSVLRSR